MSVSLRLEGSQLKISGPLDFSSVMQIWKDSIPLLKNVQNAEFNFSEVTVVKSAAVALMTEWLIYAQNHHINIKFLELPKELKSIIEISGLKQIFSNYQ